MDIIFTDLLNCYMLSFHPVHQIMQLFISRIDFSAHAAS